MAIKFKELHDKLVNDPLSHSEMLIIKEVEDYIDKEIEKNYRGEDIRIDLNIANFTYNPKTKQNRNLTSLRKNIMRAELQKRFEDAGWNTKVELADFDSYSPDYWTLSGKL